MSDTKSISYMISDIADCIDTGQYGRAVLGTIYYTGVVLGYLIEFALLLGCLWFFGSMAIGAGQGSILLTLFTIFVFVVVISIISSVLGLIK